MGNKVHPLRERWGTVVEGRFEGRYTREIESDPGCPSDWQLGVTVRERVCSFFESEKLRLNRCFVHLSEGEVRVKANGVGLVEGGGWLSGEIDSVRRVKMGEEPLFAGRAIESSGET